MDWACAVVRIELAETVLPMGLGVLLYPPVGCGLLTL